MSDAALPCIVCGHELRNVEQSCDNQPYGGTAFKTHGHYGSTAFDPMDAGDFLEVNICDPCLVRAAHAGKVFSARVERERLVYHYVPWKPDGLEHVEKVGQELGTLGAAEPLLP